MILTQNFSFISVRLSGDLYFLAYFHQIVVWVTVPRPFLPVLQDLMSESRGGSSCSRMQQPLSVCYVYLLLGFHDARNLYRKAVRQLIGIQNPQTIPTAGSNASFSPLSHCCSHYAIDSTVSLSSSCVKSIIRWKKVTQFLGNAIRNSLDRIIQDMTILADGYRSKYSNFQNFKYLFSKIPLFNYKKKNSPKQHRKLIFIGFIDQNFRKIFF